MSLESFVIKYQSMPSEDTLNALFLEQKEWSPYDGAMTNTAVVNSIANFLYSSHTVQQDSEAIVIGDDSSSGLVGSSLGSRDSRFAGTAPNTIECSLDADARMVAYVYAYPIPYNLGYRLQATHGSISARYDDTTEFRELIQVRLADPDEPITPDYPIRDLLDYEWLGDVYDSYGEVVRAPRITDVDSKLYVDSKVYGTIDVTYTVEKHVYELTISPDFTRPESDWYKSVVYAPFDGGVEWIEITPAPSSSLSSFNCGWINFQVNPDDDLPVVEGNDKKEIFDYCSNVLMETKYL